MPNLPFSFSDSQHRKHCKEAGCAHPAILRVGDMKIQGWCALCRSVAFLGKKYEDLHEV